MTKKDFEHLPLTITLICGVLALVGSLYGFFQAFSFPIVTDDGWQKAANISTVALGATSLVTLIVVAIYAVDTRRLRKNAEDQGKSSLQPIIIYERDGLRNIGRGPAFNVSIDSYESKKLTLIFAQIGLINEAPVHIEATAKVSTEANKTPSKEQPFQDCLTMGLISFPYSLVVRYSDLANNRYVSVIWFNGDHDFGTGREMVKSRFGGIRPEAQVDQTFIDGRISDHFN